VKVPGLETRSGFDRYDIVSDADLKTAAENRTRILRIKPLQSGILIKKRYKRGGCKRLFFLVPEVGIEPTRNKVPLDFESSASTSFTTPALKGQ
jgi:hypothetical protein